MKHRPLINRAAARRAYAAACDSWGMACKRAPVGFYDELEKCLAIKITAEASHIENRRRSKTKPAPAPDPEPLPAIPDQHPINTLPLFES